MESEAKQRVAGTTESYPHSKVGFRKNSVFLGGRSQVSDGCNARGYGST